MHFSRTTGVLLILALLILGAAWYLLFGKDELSSGVLPDAAPASDVEVTFLALATQINPIEFDTSILEDPRFVMLQDIRTAIIPEPSGRPDPFAPLGR